MSKKLYLRLEDVPGFIFNDLPTELLTPKSLKVFEKFNLSTEFLLIDPINWKDRQDYREGQKLIGSLRVVNDTAERGVKLIEEFNDKITKNEEQKQFLLQVRSFLSLLFNILTVFSFFRQYKIIAESTQVTAEKV